MTGLDCRTCGGPVAFRAPFCPYCRRPWAWGTGLDVERGQLLDAIDFARHPIGHGTQRADGAVITVQGTPASDALPMGLRDGCVSLTATTWSPHVAVGVSARMVRDGKAESAYVLLVDPALRAHRLERVLVRARNHAEVISDWESSPAIMGVGHPNEIELRCADSVFQVVVNGQRVTSAVDASVGFGRFGWRAVPLAELPQDKTVTLHTLSLWAAC